MGEEMLARLEWMTLQPKIILDIGCGTGEMSVQLKQRYPNASVLSFDLSEEMTQYARQHHQLSCCVCADAGKLPLPSQSVDFIFAHFLFPWHPQAKMLLDEWRRVLRENGLLMFTALGPDTLRQTVATPHLPHLVDMHDLGDSLLHEGFADPVLDVNYYTLQFRDKSTMLAELQTTGMLNPAVTAEDVSSTDAVFEVVCGHAFAPLRQTGYTADRDGMTKIPVDALKKK